MQRYYSGSYNRLSDPSDPFDPNIRSGANSPIDLEQYKDSGYHGYQQPVDTGYSNHAHTFSRDDLHPLADDYAEPKSFPAAIAPKKGMGLQQRWQQFQWTRKRKIIAWGLLAVLIVIIAIVIGVVVFEKETAFTYTPSNVQVTNAEAFASGGARRGAQHYQKNNDGIGAGSDTYTYYQGDESNFPDPHTEWISFDDMWDNNLNTLQTSCEYLGAGPNNTPEQIDDIKDAIQDRAYVSKVDHRFIFAVILQESNGCPRVGHTTSSSGVTNPGLMQSHDGDAFNKYHARDSIFAMVQDGTQGTDKGAGLVQGLNLLGNPYLAARYYNSGYIPRDGNLSSAAGATACYVTDIANRLTGWVKAKSKCPGDDA